MRNVLVGCVVSVVMDAVPWGVNRADLGGDKSSGWCRTVKAEQTDVLKVADLGVALRSDALVTY